jgi:spore coat polysaccharide biosynthesis predicted glycosyltransferase SpsG
MVRFFVEGPDEVVSFLRNRGFEIVTLAEDIPYTQEETVLSTFPQSDVTIMEMLDCNWKRQSILRKHTRQLVVFDDLLDHTYCADVVVCAQSLPGYGNIRLSSSNTQFLLGYEYFMFDPHYLSSPPHRSYRERVEKVLVAFGGGAYDIAYLKAAYSLACLTNIAVTFVFGYAKPSDLENQILEVIPNADLLRGVPDMVELFYETDLAIISAGYLKLEAAITRTPAIMIATQWHQIPLAEVFSEQIGLPYAGYMGFLEIEELKRQIKEMLTHKSRRRLGLALEDKMNGQGLNRIYSSIFEPEPGSVSGEEIANV